MRRIQVNKVQQICDDEIMTMVMIMRRLIMMITCNSDADDRDAAGGEGSYDYDDDHGQGPCSWALACVIFARSSDGACSKPGRSTSCR